MAVQMQNLPQRTPLAGLGGDIGAERNRGHCDVPRYRKLDLPAPIMTGMTGALARPPPPHSRTPKA